MGRGKRPLTPATRQVLRVLLVEPGQEFYGLQTCEATGLPSGTVHPILARLEGWGWLKSRWEIIDPVKEGRPPRRYYRWTDTGAEDASDALAQTRTQIVEAATLRTLADLDDGHIQLWVRMRFYDEMTGDRLDPPVASETHPDRAPCAGTPNPAGEWWLAFAARGWIRLPSATDKPRHNRWIVTDEGRRALEAAGLRRP